MEMANIDKQDAVEVEVDASAKNIELNFSFYKQLPEDLRPKFLAYWKNKFGEDLLDYMDFDVGTNIVEDCKDFKVELIVQGANSQVVPILWEEGLADEALGTIAKTFSEKVNKDLILELIVRGTNLQDDKVKLITSGMNSAALLVAASIYKGGPFTNNNEVLIAVIVLAIYTGFTKYLASIKLKNKYKKASNVLWKLGTASTIFGVVLSVSLLLPKKLAWIPFPFASALAIVMLLP